MCGICGIYDIKGNNRIDKGVLGKMIDTINHRGPDGMDIFLDKNVGLGFNRLSIIDLHTGMQPITNENGNLILICNGEIFNYLELRDNLIGKGHQFKTNTDVEVIIHMYEEYDTEFINKLNGQFSFAIFDKQKKKLFCARDHVGIAPFFYTEINGCFIFASEIKAIIQHPLVKAKLDLVGLDQMMTFPGLIGFRTFFKNINSLESGHYLTIDPVSGVNKKKYWDLVYPKIGANLGSYDEKYYIEKLDDLISQAVKLRLQADVPVGYYVSGGLDSSIIAAKIMEKKSSQKRHSFSINFEDKSISESKYQNLLTNKFNSIHHEKSFKWSDIDRNLKAAVYHSESALKETYNTASFVLSENVNKQNIKVVLTGEGADELFGGYVGYRFDEFRKSQNNNLSSDERMIRKRIWNNESFLYEKDFTSIQDYKSNIYSKELIDNYSNINCLNYPILDQAAIENIDLFNLRSYVDFKLRLPDHLLSDHGDRMVYANSVEARYPFLDINLIEFAAHIPSNLKLKAYQEKYLLKQVAKNIVPEEIIRRPKFTFVAPGSVDLLKNNPEYYLDLLSFDRISKQKVFNPNMIEKLTKQYTQPNFKLNLPFDTDMLIIPITLSILMEEFDMEGI